MNDGRDQKILALLQENGEMPLSEIAEKVCLSPSACSRRLARLGSVDGFDQDEACGDCDDGCEILFGLLAS
ncbi:Lrp/AsnC family transcriptional regulator [Rhizobium lemnae]